MLGTKLHAEFSDTDVQPSGQIGFKVFVGFVQSDGDGVFWLKR